MLEAGYHLETLGEVWPVAQPEERQRMCRLMLRAVYVDMERQRIVRVMPEEDFRLLFRYHPGLEGDEEGGYRVRGGVTDEVNKPA